MHAPLHWFQMQITKTKTFVGYLKDKTPNAVSACWGKITDFYNVRLSPWGVGWERGEKTRKTVVLSFNVTWAWHSFTRVTCQGTSIKGTCDFLSHPYTSTSKRLRGFTRTHPRCSRGKSSSTGAAKTGYFKQCKRHWSPINFHKGITG